MPVDRSHIRVKALFIAPHPDGDKHAVSLCPPSAENPGGYYRYVGGSVELGESHEQAVRREVQEELSATIEQLTYLGVCENIFRIDGELGHEIVFIYTGWLDPMPPDEDAQMVEIDGSVMPIHWVDWSAESVALPLYPASADHFLSDAREWLASHPCTPSR